MKIKILILAGLVSTFVAGYFVGGFGAKKAIVGESPDTLYAIADGKKIRAEDVADEIKDDLVLLKKSEYLIKKNAVETYLFGKQPSPGSSGVEYSEEEFAQFVKERRLNYSKLSPKAQSDVLSNFKIYKRAILKKSQIQNIEWHIPRNYLEAPVVVGPGFLPDLDSKDAKSKVVVFANYHCPYCKEAQSKIEALKTRFGGKVSIHFRFSMQEPENSIAYLSALAAGCAMDQSKFPEMHQALFLQNPLTQSQLESVAQSLKLNMTEFTSCLSSIKYKSKIEADVADAEKLGINREAVIYVNGTRFQAQDPLDELLSLVN